MRRKVKVEVVTETGGQPGGSQTVERRTITVNSRDCRKLKREQFRKEKGNRELSEQQRLAALYLAWEEDLSDLRG